MGFQSCLLRLLPFAAMVMLEFVDTGLNVISKAAMSKGMSHFVFVVYSNALATLIMFLPSFFFYRLLRTAATAKPIFLFSSFSSSVINFDFFNLYLSMCVGRKDHHLPTPSSANSSSSALLGK